jgi:hypothetical protein
MTHLSMYTLTGGVLRIQIGLRACPSAILEQDCVYGTVGTVPLTRLMGILDPSSKPVPDYGRGGLWEGGRCALSKTRWRDYERGTSWSCRRCPKCSNSAYATAPCCACRVILSNLPHFTNAGISILISCPIKNLWLCSIRFTGQKYSMT